MSIVSPRSPLSPVAAAKQQHRLCDALCGYARAEAALAAAAASLAGLAARAGLFARARTEEREGRRLLGPPMDDAAPHAARALAARHAAALRRGAGARGLGAAAGALAVAAAAVAAAAAPLEPLPVARRARRTAAADALHKAAVAARAAAAAAAAAADADGGAADAWGEACGSSEPGLAADASADLLRSLSASCAGLALASARGAFAAADAGADSDAAVQLLAQLRAAGAQRNGGSLDEEEVEEEEEEEDALQVLLDDAGDGDGASASTLASADVGALPAYVLSVDVEQRATHSVISFSLAPPLPAPSVTAGRRAGGNGADDAGAALRDAAVLHRCWRRIHAEAWLMGEREIVSEVTA